MPDNSIAPYRVLPESHPHSPETIPTYRVYSVRWIVVLILALINGTNAYLWLSFAPVANHFVAYYSTHEYLLNWMQLIFPITTVVFGIPASLIVDWFGIRFVLLSSAVSNFACAILRILSSFGVSWVSRDLKLFLVFAGQLIASFAQPLCMFAPTKLALEWFADHQRTIANTIGSLGNAVGVLVASGLAPLFVSHAADIPRFNYISLGITAFGFLVTVIFVRRSKPKTPPSVAAAVVEQLKQTERRSPCCRLRTFLVEVYTPLKSFQFWLLMLSFGSALAYFTTLSTLLEQILCAKGYRNESAGLFGSLMLIAGLLFSGLIAVFADRTGLLSESVKVLYMLALLGAVGMSMLLYFPHHPALFVLCIMWFGGCGFGVYSLVLELAAEITFPVPEAITTGLLISFSQVLAILFVLFMQAVAPVAKDTAEFQSRCGLEATALDYSLPNLIICGVITVIGMLQLFLFNAPYKRREASLNKTVQVDATAGQTDSTTNLQQCDGQS